MSLFLDHVKLLSLVQPGHTNSQLGSDGNEVDLVNEAVEAAIRISAHVEFTDNEYLEEIGGIAALLRW